MQTIGVVGLGAMGLGIAQVFAQAGFAVRATDAHAAARASAGDRLRQGFAPRIAAGKMTGAEADALIGRLAVLDDPGDIAPADMVIEAIAEDLHAKRALLAYLEAHVAAGTVLATNTSSLGVGALAAGLLHPERVLGLHFFNPAPVMKLVELAGHAGTAHEALARARDLTQRAGKTVIRCADRPGFIVNRCARPFYGEALALLEEGRPAGEIDAAMLAAGYRMGPFTLIDLIGADVHLAATEGVWRGMGEHPRYHVFDALIDRVRSGDLGRKSGRGFLFPDGPGAAPQDADMIVLRIEAMLANEAAFLLAEGGVAADDIDLAMKLGLNFPRGPFEALRRHGPDRVRALLSDLDRRCPLRLQGRYRAAPTLGDLA
jgi:3-hydroxybutyryl-CoA dehydrogenase